MALPARPRRQVHTQGGVGAVHANSLSRLHTRERPLDKEMTTPIEA
jgi:hypothetical protein